jgi:UDP-N-acetylglucosamine diphosphorylase / glucose-1-phosphate thymidylyltransferase / UDP-N-acetylgalactosamine diphosphorylase / glucosamine-1-phosphate N-acetyltransferase / galactosamine-1-phosphate N-acetyltransferase
MQAVILAAGEGKRVRPLTWSRPKAMIPVANRPIIGYVIDALVKNGIRDIIVVVGYRKEQVTRFLNQLEIPVQVVVQDKQLGTAHALRQAESKITGDFLVLPGDNYIDAQSIARIKAHQYAMLVKEHPSPSNFGVVLVKEGNIESIVEKPDHAPSFIVSTGIYSLNADFFPFINENNTITDSIAGMLNDGQQIRAITAEDWQDAIYPWDLLRMNERLLRDLPAVRKGTTSRQTTIEGAVRIGRGSTIGPNTMIAGPVLIGDDCSIGPNCCILPNTSIGSRVTIEPFTCIGNALVMDDTAIGSHSRIVDTVIGERCVLGDHTSTSTAQGILEIEGNATWSTFGAIIGDNVKSGAFTIFRNSIIGNNVTIEGECRIVSRIIADDALVI